MSYKCKTNLIFSCDANIGIKPSSDIERNAGRDIPVRIGQGIIQIATPHSGIRTIVQIATAEDGTSNHYHDSHSNTNPKNPPLGVKRIGTFAVDNNPVSLSPTDNIKNVTKKL